MWDQVQGQGACGGMCPASCQTDIDDLIASCRNCALADVACDAPVDTDLDPSSGGPAFEYKAPVVMAGGDMDDDCYKYLDENEDEEGLEGQLEDDMQCLDRGFSLPELDCGGWKTAKARPRSSALAVRRTGHSPASRLRWRRTSRISS